MFKKLTNRLFRGKHLSLFAAIIMTFTMFGVAPQTTTEAATGVTPFNLVFYGSHDSTTDQRIVNANPMFLIDNTPKNPWHGNCNAAYFASYGIKVFSYISAGYEGTGGRAIPTDLQSNLNFIDAIATEPGVYGIFMDEVSSYPSSAGIYYLSQIYNRVKQHGLELIINPGVDSWSDTIMQYTDYIQSSEIYAGAAMTPSQQKWASRIMLLSQGIYDANTAANLTNGAISKGFLAHYATPSYMGLPSYLETYVSLVGQVAPAPTPPPTPTPTPTPNPTLGNTTGTVASTPVSSGGTNEYNLFLRVTSTTVTGLTTNQQIWCAATTTDFPNLLTVGSTLTGNLDQSPGWWVLKKASNPTPAPIPTPTPTPTPNPTLGNTTGTVASTPVSSGGTNEYNLFLRVASTTVTGLTTNQQIWCAATTTDFPNLLTVGSTLTGNLDQSPGWWVLKKASNPTPAPIPTPTPTPTPNPTLGNTTGTVASTPVSSGGTNEYNLFLRVASTTVTGLTTNQQIWCAATTTDFPNLLTVGSTLTGNLDQSPGWWVLKKASNPTPAPIPTPTPTPTPTPPPTGNMLPLAVTYYGPWDTTLTNRIIAAKPAIVVSGTPASWQHGTAPSIALQNAGIMVFSYIHMSYGAVPLSYNLAFVDALYAEGTKGVFLDEAPGNDDSGYIAQIYARCKQYGMKLMVNPGMSYISPSLMAATDYAMTDEHYAGRAPSAAEAPYASRLAVIGFPYNDPNVAAGYTKAAWQNGFGFSYHALPNEYGTVPYWFEQYISALSGASTLTPAAVQ